SMSSAIKSYKSVLRPNERKNQLLKSTIQCLEDGSAFFFKMLQGLFGGITPEIVRFSTEQEKQQQDIALWCAVNWFRPVSQDSLTHTIASDNLVEKFEEYYGGTASDAIKQYFSASIGESYYWNDCRQQYYDLCRELGVEVSDLTHDLEILCREKCLAVATESNQNNSIISVLFGTGEKEDRSVKLRITKKILEAISNLKEIPKNVAPIQEIILNVAKATKETFRQVYAGNLGAPSTLEKFIAKDGQKEFDLKKLQTDLKKVIRGKSKERDWCCQEELRSYVEQNTIQYDLWAWGEMFNKAHTALKIKSTRNYNFAKQRLEQFKEIQSLNNLLVVKKLNDFFDSEFFSGEETYTICVHHLGGKDLSKLYKAWEDDPADPENAIVVLCDDLKNNFKKEPIRNILRYIFTIRQECSAQDILAAAKYNQQLDRYKSQKANPSVLGNQGFTWTNAVILPEKAQRNDRPNSLDLRIWLYLKLRHPDGRWKKHHIPFYDTRFFQEIYAAGNSPVDTCQFRTPRFGYHLPKLTDQTAIRVNKKHVKAAKTEARIRLAIQQGTLPVSNLKITEISATINSKGQVRIPVKFDVGRQKGTLQIGDRFCGYDQNQTASHAYSLWEVVKEGQYHKELGCFVRFISSGDIVSITENRGNQFDQLSYEGLAYPQYADWRKKASKFVSLWQITKKNKKKEIVTVEAKEKFDAICKYQPRLYKFNKEYAYLLRDIVRGKSLVELQQIRQEIFRFIEQDCGVTRLGSLSLSTLETVKAVKGIIYSYFSTALNASKNNPISDEQRKEFDPELFALLEKLELIRTRKKKQKVERIANSLIQTCLENNIKFIRGEGDLSTTNNATKKKANSRSMDWLARGVFNKIRQLAPMHNITLFGCGSLYTSHQDPLVHRNPDKAMKCRWAAIPVKDIGDWVLRKLSQNLRAKNIGTGEYYHQGVKEFLSHYELQDLEEELLKWRSDRKSNIPCWVLQNRLAEKLGNKEAVVYIPVRGGRIYFATHKVATGAVSIVFDQKQVWVCNADHVAAANIALTVKGIGEQSSDEENPDGSRIKLQLTS
uniref:Cas12i2 n=1 Tax=unidentified TaxID=32644 RepID=UPI00186BC2EA|nr:Chain A, Cas12i2 [unidentified]6LTP_G Chain G, Cas12i2 [unidentified]6LTU_A Chain A, Cas12i2 [unidentified]